MVKKRMLWIIPILLLIICVLLYYYWYIIDISFKEGLISPSYADYNIPMTYTNLVSPFDETNTLAVANSDPDYIYRTTNTQVYNGEFGNNPVTIDVERVGWHSDDNWRIQQTCGQDIHHCGWWQWSAGSGNSVNVNFADTTGYTDLPNHDSININCSRWGVFDSKTRSYGPPFGWPTITTSYLYNTDQARDINDCLYNQRQSVLQMCTTAQNNLNKYASNIPANISSTAQPLITQYIRYGQLKNTDGGGQYWSYFGDGTETEDPTGSWTLGQWDNNYSDTHARDILPQLQTAWTNCNTQNNIILDSAHNTCANENTLLDVAHISQCDIDGNLPQMNDTRNQYCNNTLQYTKNALDASNQSLVQNWLAFDPLQDVDFTYTTKQIADNLSNQIQNCTTMYNDCSNQNTLMDPNGLIQCLGNEYSLTYNTCQSTLSQATSFNDTNGYDAVNNMWNDTSNNKLIGYGNPLHLAAIALSTAKTKCDRQTQMYNQWSEYEDQAKHEPCIPEQPVLAQSDIELTNITKQWSATSLDYLQSLQKRITVIQQYISNYPHILTMDPSGVTMLPSEGVPLFSIAATPPNASGIAPVQTLTVKIPSGAPGPQGPQGRIGPNGFNGGNGKMGPSGADGKWEIPEQYIKPNM